MYQPKFNSVLVEIDDKEGNWGGSGDDSVMGKSYNKGKVIQVGNLHSTHEHPLEKLEKDTQLSGLLTELKGKDIMWNEGDEAGVTFEENGKLYGFIYYWNIRGCRDE